MTSWDKQTRERVAFVIAAVITALAVFALFWRLRRGIDFTDEAFYVALPLRFALGDQPFVDELNLAQCAGVLLYPFVQLHVMVRGTTGIFFFIRCLYAVFFGGVACAAYALARTRLPKHTALLASAPCIAFVPYGIPGLSYNTLGCGLLALGLFLVTGALLSPPTEPKKLYRDRLTWGGFALGAACFAYPSFILGALAATAAAFMLSGGRRVLSAGRVALGGALFALVISPVFIAAGSKHLRETFAYSGGAGITLSLKQLGVLWDKFMLHHPGLPTMTLTVAVAVVLARKWPRLVVLGLPLLAAIPRDSLSGITLTATDFVASFALTGPLFALALRDGRTARTIFAGIWVPSALCGAACAWTSTIGVFACGLGLFSGAVASGILLAMWIGELVQSFRSAELRVLFGFAPVTFLYILVRFLVHDERVYNDGKLPELTARVTEGPYKGLLTTPSRKEMLATMSADILDLTRTPRARALFYYEFPVGYLIASNRPLVGSTWIFPTPPRIFRDVEKFTSKATPGDLVFRVGAMAPNDPLDAAVTARCDAVGTRSGYTVWRVR